MFLGSVPAKWSFIVLTEDCFDRGSVLLKILYANIIDCCRNIPVRPITVMHLSMKVRMILQTYDHASSTMPVLWIFRYFFVKFQNRFGVRLAGLVLRMWSPPRVLQGGRFSPKLVMDFLWLGSCVA